MRSTHTLNAFPLLLFCLKKFKPLGRTARDRPPSHRCGCESTREHRCTARPHAVAHIHCSEGRSQRLCCISLCCWNALQHFHCCIVLHRTSALILVRAGQQGSHNNRKQPLHFKYIRVGQSTHISDTVPYTLSCCPWPDENSLGDTDILGDLLWCEVMAVVD
jgi:hypothetical protein